MTRQDFENMPDEAIVRLAQEASAGLITGTTTRAKMPNSLQPSMRAASTISSGTSMMYWRM